jgi:uncharacterized protein (TIGR04255 family)
MAEILKNKPLVEAVFEIRWLLRENEHGGKIDPHYSILIGALYERVKDKYPFHERLMAASVPDDLLEWVVQHRFRCEQDRWPLIQIGPGVLTLNDTQGYTWDDFHRRMEALVRIFFDVYPTFPSIQHVRLRYINAIPFDYEQDNVLDFLRDQLKIDVRIHEGLFADTEVRAHPDAFDMRFAYRSNRPAGSIQLRLARGQKQERDILIWETFTYTTTKQLFSDPDSIVAWADQAHDLIEDWFFKLIDGELIRRFE